MSALQNSFKTSSLILGFDAVVNKSATQMPKRLGKLAGSVIFYPSFLLSSAYMSVSDKTKLLFGIFEHSFTSSSAKGEEISPKLGHGSTQYLMFSLSSCKPMTTRY